MSTVNCQLSVVNCQEEPFRQHLSWGVFVSPNLTGWSHNLDTISTAPDRIHPHFGVDAGFYLNFHVTPQWSILFGSNITLEQLRLSTNNENDNLSTLGADIDLSLSFSIPCNNLTISLALGPYTHFMLYDLSNDPAMHPYSRNFSYNPRNEEPVFRLNDFNAGVAAQISCLNKDGWQLFCKFRLGITDILNIDSHRLFVRPYKLSLGLAYNL